MRPSPSIVALAALSGLASAADAGPVKVRVSVRNLAPSNSIAFAPLRLGFNDGAFDSFNAGQAATAPIISIAEGGSGDDWFPAFEAAQPSATLGTVVPNPPGPLLPGGFAGGVFTVDPAINRSFTFGAMVVPSNDYFIGNDSPTEHLLLDDMGNLLIDSITLTASDIWDAGSELDGPFGAAFLEGSNNDDRIPENGVVGFDFQGLADNFNGLTTAAGYVFDSRLAADTAVYRIRFTIVPAPGAAALLVLSALSSPRRRRCS